MKINELKTKMLSDLPDLDPGEAGFYFIEYCDLEGENFFQKMNSLNEFLSNLDDFSLVSETNISPFYFDNKYNIVEFELTKL